MNFISFSLYGHDRKYLEGAIRNIELAEKLLPDWQCVFFVDHETWFQNREVAEVIRTRAHRRIMGPKDHDINPLCWRFLIADNPEAHRFIVRDADSRISHREVAAIQAWIDSGLPFHTMRDHPAHGRFIHGGMWGAIKGILPNIQASYHAWWKKKGKDYTQPDPDQQYLEDVITPLVKGNCLQHDSNPNRGFKNTYPFPTKRIGREHVGAVWEVNEDGSEQIREHDAIQVQPD